MAELAVAYTAKGSQSKVRPIARVSGSDHEPKVF